MEIIHCKVNHLTNPLGYSMEKPVFSWTVDHAEGKFQTAARIRVYCCGETVADTGWAELDSLAAEVELKLRPRTRYSWTVTVRTDAGEEAVSDENWFETGKMEEPWQAQWIGCGDADGRHPVFYKEIQPKGAVKSARLYICGLGLYEARWNEEKIGGEYLTPYCNNYNEWLQYQTYDVTAQLQESGTLAVELGNGWYKGRFGFDNCTGGGYYGDHFKLVAELCVAYADGREEIICTDESWMLTRSNIYFSNIYDGEHRDDTLDAVEPVSAESVEPPKGVLTARLSTPVTVQQRLPVKERIHTPAGETVLDVGQNMTGSFRLAVHEPAGTNIHIQFGEILQNGNFYRENLRSAKAEYVYISDGQPHILEPKFTFFGYRYVKIQGVADLKAEDFTALVLHSELPLTGQLTTGNALVNQLLSNIQWGQLGNFLDVPTDCPQRDERMGWTGDAQVFAPTACYQRESYAFFQKYLFDLASEQKHLDGAVPIVVPGFGKTESSAAWGDAACVIPWTLYEMYGDRTILENQYGSMTAWVDYMTRLETENHGWLNHFHFGDWLALDGPGGPEGVDGGTDKALIAAAYYRRSALLTAKAARVLGKTADAEIYEALAQKMLRYIQEEYFTSTGRCAVNTQTGYLLALADGLNPHPERARQELLDKLGQQGGMLQTGFVGTPMLCVALTKAGEPDMAFDLLLNEGYPGWLYAVKMGATTVWERWNSVLPDGSISGTGMNSLNHYSYGAIAQWLYEDVAGLAPLAPGFRRARLAPHFHRLLKHTALSYDSAAGRWETAWQLNADGTITYRCTVPFGCTAELVLPYGGEQRELQAGAYEVTYQSDRQLLGNFSTQSTIGELLGNPRVKAALQKIIPQISMLPPSMFGLTLRQMGGRMPPEQLDKLDAYLSSL